MTYLFIINYNGMTINMRSGCTKLDVLFYMQDFCKLAKKDGYSIYKDCVQCDGVAFSGTKIKNVPKNIIIPEVFFRDKNNINVGWWKCKEEISSLMEEVSIV